MGYYSELTIEANYREDHSYTSPEMQLRWRIEDLQSHLEDIAGGKYGVTAHYYMGCRYSKEDLAYVPPEYFSRASDIMTAISIAEEKLALMEAEECEIQLKESNVPEIEEIPGQLTIWDILQREDIIPVQTGELIQAA
ncbi:hypothetical protein LI177_00510 [bacterium 210820-DFI.6.37]|nr:hypothetical protein [bacterium 210820-DFI.6.37]